MYKAVGQSTLVPALVELVDQSLGHEWMLYYNFMALPVPRKIVMTDPFFQALAHRHTFHAGVLKMPENTCYDWHTDTNRKVSINMLLSDTRSDCLFMDGVPGMSFRFNRLSYLPETYYAFNTQVPHTVLNYSGDRYLFSVEFLDSSRDLTFDELCAELKD